MHRIIILAALTGIVFHVFAIPPWQGADEIFHFESALLHGLWFPSLPFRPDIPLQFSITRSMHHYHFWDYIHSPPPEGPARFVDEPFLRDAPSKLGRPPLFYFLSGIPLRLSSGHLIAGLFIMRSLNALWYLLTIIMLLDTIQLVRPSQPIAAVSGAALLLFNPAYVFQSATANITAWSVFLSSFGLLVAVRILRKGWKTERVLLFVLYLTLAVGTHHTVFVLAVLLGLLLLGDWISVRRRIFVEKGPAVLLLVSLMLGTGLAYFSYTTAGGSQFFYEINHITSGFDRFQEGFGAGIFYFLSLIYSTFWFGFGWLTVPCPGSLRIFYLIPSILLIYLFFKTLLDRNQRRERYVQLCLLIVTLIFTATLIRSYSSSPATQGRYLYPALPFLAILAAEWAVRLTSKSHRARFFISATLGLSALLGTCSVFLCWYKYFYLDSMTISGRLAAMEQITLDTSSPGIVLIDVGSENSHDFRDNGWYPEEETHSWLRFAGGIRLPLLPELPLEFKAEVFPYVTSPDRKRLLSCFFNGEEVYRNQLDPCWQIISGFIDPLLIRPVSKFVFLSGDPSSPLDVDGTYDSRSLSIACKWLKIYPRNMETNRILWKIDDSGLQIDVYPGDRMGIRGKSGSFALKDGSGQPVRLKSREIWTAQSHHSFMEIKNEHSFQLWLDTFRMIFLGSFAESRSIFYILEPRYLLLIFSLYLILISGALFLVHTKSP